MPEDEIDLSQLVTEISRRISSRLLELFQRGNALSRVGYAGYSLEDALRAYDEALEEAPSFLEAWNNKGCALWHLGRYKDALECFEKALELAPNFDIALQNKAGILHAMGKYAEAIRIYDELLGENRENWRALYGKGRALFYLHNFGEADKYYKLAYFFSARELFEQKNFKFALDSINRALKIEPQNREFLRLKIKILHALGRNREAQQIIDSIEHPF